LLLKLAEVRRKQLPFLHPRPETPIAMTTAKTRARIISIFAIMLATSTVIPAEISTSSDRVEDRAAALTTYDRDGDGRLSDTEREAMRKQIFEQRRRNIGNGRGRMAFQFPPEIVKKYDKDGDGQLNEEESQAARVGIQKMFQELHAKYDANGNGRLDPEEMDKIQADKAAGKLEDVPQMFLQMGGRRRPASGSCSPRSGWSPRRPAGR
jgi:Ca2+-binding EF-hand superfamily protein